MVTMVHIAPTLTMIDFDAHDDYGTHVNYG